MSTTKQRRSSTEQYWRRMVEQWRGSGLSVRDFCAEQGISEPSLYAWRRTIARRDAEAAQFIPVHVVPDEQGAARDVSGQGLELLLSSGRVLRIGRDFDGATLQRLLALLEDSRA